MPWISTAIQVGGGLLAGSGASGGASNAASVTQAQIDKANKALEFNPYAVKTGFGSSYFDTEKGTAGYKLDPRLAAYQKQQYYLANQALSGLNLDPTQAAQALYKQQQGLMAGDRQAQDIALRQQQLQSGRIGLGLSGEAMGAGAGTGDGNPEQYQRDLARAKADAELAFSSRAQAQQEIDNAIARSQGLFGYGTGIEKLGMTPLDYSIQMQQLMTPLQTARADVELGGGKQLAEYGLASDLAESGMLSGAAKALSGMNFNTTPSSNTAGVSALGGNASRGYVTGGW